MGIFVLSLFDGMSCGMIALNRAGIDVEWYGASEIDKYANHVSLKNYPQIIRLGDIENWREWNIPQPDLVIGGSPCQGFSNAGKGLSFDDPRSKLFFIFVEIIRHYKPKFFLLENVRMKQEWRDVITSLLGVEPMRINSALVSAQNRVRDYWFNWECDQPEDKGILLEDILLAEVDDNVISHNLDANLQAVFKKNYVQWDKSGKGHNSQDQRAYYKKGKHGALPNARAGTKEKVYLGDLKYRNLVPIECERLQTVPDCYTDGVKDSSRYKMLGNGWTVDVLAHIFRGLPKTKAIKHNEITTKQSQ